MKKTYTLTVLLAGIIISSCVGPDDGTPEPVKNKVTESASTDFSIPELPEREILTGTPEERDHIRDVYDQAVLDLEKNKDNYDAKLRMAEVFVQEARVTGNFGKFYKSAHYLLDHILESDVNQDQKFQALSLKATVLLSEHKFAKAKTVAESAVKISPYNAGIYGALVDANVELGNYEEAVEMADRMVQIRPDLRSYSRVSYLREIHGDVDGAIEAMDMAVKSGLPGQEQTAWSRVTLAKLYESKGDLSSAEMHYSIALSNRPNYPFALAGLGRIEWKKGNLEIAEKKYLEAISFMPNAGFYEELALLSKQQGSKEQTKKYYQLTLKEMGGGHGHSHAHSGSHSHKDHGHSHEVGLEMGRLLLEFNSSMKKAKKNAEHEKNLRPNNIEVNQLLAAVYYYEGNIDEAAKYIELANATQSKNSELMNLNGLILLKQGDKSGKDLIKKSFEMNPYQFSKISNEAKSHL